MYDLLKAEAEDETKGRRIREEVKERFQAEQIISDNSLSYSVLIYSALGKIKLEW